jgi:hypothetical protein
MRSAETEIIMDAQPKSLRRRLAGTVLLVSPITVIAAFILCFITSIPWNPYGTDVYLGLAVTAIILSGIWAIKTGSLWLAAFLSQSFFWALGTVLAFYVNSIFDTIK